MLLIGYLGCNITMTTKTINGLGKVTSIPQVVKIRKTNYLDFNMSLNSLAEHKNGRNGILTGSPSTPHHHHSLCQVANI